MGSEFALTGQGLLQLEELGLAFVLSALVGLEREIYRRAQAFGLGGSRRGLSLNYMVVSACCTSSTQ
jgi:hypothetical protein